MGNDSEYTANINKKLIKLGYHDNPIWATRKFPYTEVLSEVNFDEAINKNRMIHLETKDDIKYGILRPVGYKKYISQTNVNQFRAIRKIYGEQTTGLYIGYTDDKYNIYLNIDDANILKEYNCGIIVCNKDSDTSNIVAEILKIVKE